MYTQKPECKMNISPFHQSDQLLAKNNKSDIMPASLKKSMPYVDQNV